MAQSTDEKLAILVSQNTVLQETVSSLIQVVTKQAEIQTKVQEHSSPQNRVTTSNPGIPFDKYDESCEDFESFVDRFHAYVELREIPEHKKVDCFITAIGPRLFQLLKTLLYPDVYKTKSVDDLQNLLRDHLAPKPLMIPSRHSFLNRKQHEGESIATYLKELRKLAAPCRYPSTMLPTMLRDVLVGGLRDKIVLDRLFEEDDISLSDTIRMAQAIEKAALSSQNILTSSYSMNMLSGRNSNTQNDSKNISGTLHLHRPKKSPTLTSTKPSPNDKVQCVRCAQFSHTAKSCTATNLFCTYCKKPNHVMDVCFARKYNPSTVHVLDRDTNECSVQEPDQDTVNCSTIPIFSLTSTSNQPLMVSIEINGKYTSLELDTGSAVTVIDHDTFRTLPRVGNLNPSNAVFRAYNHGVIRPLGEMFVNVRYKENSKSLKLFVVTGKHTPLLGRDWIYALNILPNQIDQLMGNQETPLKIEPLLKKYQNVFDESIQPIKGYTYDITLAENAHPRFRRARKVPFALQTRVEQEIARLEKEGIIQKTTHSEWATPVVPIVKPNGSIRLCADYSRTVNDQMIVPQHPFKGFDEVLETLRGGQKFSTLDVRTAFLHIPVTERTAGILTINTHLGLYNAKRLMFGISSAPAVWQAYIEGVTSGLHGVTVVHDDIIVTGEDDNDHCKNLVALLEKLNVNGIHLNKEKCKFLQERVKYLGYILDSDGIRETPEKIQSILACKTPTNIHEVKSFLGMVTFYGRFLNNLATIATPLYDLLKRKNNEFQWTSKEDGSFQAIKSEIASDKLLVHYDPKLPLILSADASPTGIGAVLAHLIDGIERPIAFASRVLNSSEKNYSQIDREALAIKWAVSKFVHYLYGREFTLYTDHMPLTHIFSKRQELPVITASRLLRYALFLQTFNFNIRYRKSSKNSNADCLSRLPNLDYCEEVIKENSIFHLERWDPSTPDETSLFFLEQLNTLPVLSTDIADETKNDPETSKILTALRCGGVGTFPDHNWTLQGECIMVGSRVFIPQKFRKQVLDELHLGHIGVVKMKALARSHVYWPGIDRDIEQIVKNCTNCILTANNPQKTQTHCWEYPTRPWQRIHIDHAGPFMGSMFFLVVDAHSKWVETFIVPSTSSSNTIKILESLFAHYGIPETIVSDNAASFTGSEFQQFVRTYHISHKTSAPFHPASNGQAERYVATFKRALKCLQSYPGTTQQRLNTFLYTYRRAPNITTGYSPAMLFLGREIRSRLDIMRPDPIKAITERIKSHQSSFINVPEFMPGEVVAVRSYQSPNQKWAIGRVIAKDGTLHYTVQVRGEMWRRHVNQMQKIGNQVNPDPTIPQSTIPSYIGKIPHSYDGRATSATQASPKEMDIPMEPEREPFPPTPRTSVQTPMQRRDQTSEEPQSPTPESPQNVPITQTVLSPMPLRRSSRTRKAPIRLDL